MKYRLLTEEDYDVLVGWWKFWRFSPPPKHLLPDLGLGGIMITDDSDKPLSAGFLYHTNSSIAWIEFIVANPEQSKESRKESLVYLLDKLKYLCKEHRYALVFSSIKHPNLLDRYQEAGFKIGTTNTNEVICNLWE